MFGLRSIASRPKLALFTTAAAVAYGAYSVLKSRRSGGLPAPGPKKQDPEQLDRMHDTAVEDSMIASDPPSTAQPDVRTP
jgi:hypothetical protein